MAVGCRSVLRHAGPLAYVPRNRLQCSYVMMQCGSLLPNRTVSLACPAFTERQVGVGLATVLPSSTTVYYRNFRRPPESLNHRLTRAPLGGNLSPSSIFSIAPKRQHISTRRFSYLIRHQFVVFYQKFGKIHRFFLENDVLVTSCSLFWVKKRQMFESF